MGRTLTITVRSGSDLTTADGEELAVGSFVVVCFDGDVSRELGRTEVSSETSSPEWEHTFDAEVTPSIEAIVEETGSEPEKLTFCLYTSSEEDDVEVTQREPLGIAGVDFSDLLKAGGYDGELSLSRGEGGSGSLSVSVQMKKVRIGSMLQENAALKIAGGVAGVAALGALGTYLYKKHQRKKDKLAEEQGEGEEGATPRTGVEYGANILDEDDEEEGEEGITPDGMKPWYEMDDEQDEDEEENRWGDVDSRWGGVDGE